MRILVSVAGGLVTMLGGLWFLQGLGVIHVRPILCFADCAAIQGRSMTWTAVGLIAISAGVLAIALSLRRR